MNILFHYDASPLLAREFEGLSARGLSVAVCGEADDAALARLVPETEVLWHVLRPVTADLVAAAPRLRLIQKIGIGVNTIDLEAAKQAGIRVCNMPGTNSRAVAEHTLALILAALRRVVPYDAATRAGEGWRLPAGIQDHLGEIAGKRIGLVGYGAVPQILAPILSAMGADVSYTARSRKPIPATWQDLDTLLTDSDIVSLHVPLSPATDQMIDAAAISRMKRGAILVNTARGGLVDQAALHRALVEGHLGAAALDVFADEPVSATDPVLGLDNVVVTPHIAWLTRETMQRSLAVAVENCRRLGADEPLLHQVV